MSGYVAVGSLIVAALAVFVGPVLSYIVTKKQITSFLAASHWQVVAPMRQAWINNLREMLSDFFGNVLLYYRSLLLEQSDPEKFQNIIKSEYQIKLMLNPQEDDHQELEKLIHSLVFLLECNNQNGKDFDALYKEVIARSRVILKREWNRVKEHIITNQ